MSQSALASAMRGRGWKWSQPTVAAIEKGERALKVAEVEDLVAILGTEVMGLLSGEVMLRSGFERVEHERNLLVAAVGNYTQALVDYARLADSVSNLSVDERFWLDMYMPSQTALSVIGYTVKGYVSDFSEPAGEHTTLLRDSLMFDLISAEAIERARPLGATAYDEYSPPPLPLAETYDQEISRKISELERERDRWRGGERRDAAPTDSAE